MNYEHCNDFSFSTTKLVINSATESKFLSLEWENGRIGIWKRFVGVDKISWRILEGDWGCCICPHCNMYFSIFQNIFAKSLNVVVQFRNGFVEIAKCICPNLEVDWSWQDLLRIPRGEPRMWCISRISLRNKLRQIWGRRNKWNFILQIRKKSKT